MYTLRLLSLYLCVLRFTSTTSAQASNSTLPSRGAGFAAASNQRDSFAQLYGNDYNPETNPDGLVNFGIAENTAARSGLLSFAESLNYGINAETFRRIDGPWGLRRLRAAMANHVNTNFGTYAPFNETEVLLSTGVTGMFELLAFTLFNAGDGLMMTVPTYGGFVGEFAARAGVVPVFVSPEEADTFSPDIADKFEETYQQATNTTIRAVILCNPHNPLGRNYPKDTLIAIMKFAAKHNLHIISDEIYALSSRNTNSSEAVPFQSVYSFDFSTYIDPKYVHVLYGMSKDFVATGLRLGSLLTKNAELNRAVTLLSTFSWVGNADQQIATLMLEDIEGNTAFSKYARQVAAKAEDLTRSVLDEAGIEYERRANAGFYLWVDLRPFLPEDQPPAAGEAAVFSAFFEQNLFLTPGSSMRAESPGFFRLCYSHEEPYLREGLRRFLSALASVSTNATSDLQRLSLEI